jgi:methionine-rich copper-binding protein CopC
VRKAWRSTCRAFGDRSLYPEDLKSIEMKRLLSKVLLAALTAMLASPAGAHAHLERGVPAAGSTVHASPPLLKLWFTERLEPAFFKVHVLDRNGKQVDIGDPAVDRADAKLLRVSLPKLAPGTYRVQWRVLSVDTHVSEGDFTFDVAP